VGLGVAVEVAGEAGSGAVVGVGLEVTVVGVGLEVTVLVGLGVAVSVKAGTATTAMTWVVPKRVNVRATEMATVTETAG